MVSNTKEGKYAELMIFLFELNPFERETPAVILAGYENCIRYLPFFQWKSNEHYLQVLVQLFLSPQGIFSSNGKVASRTAYFFLRMFERMKKFLISQCPFILEKLKEAIDGANNGTNQV